MARRTHYQISPTGQQFARIQDPAEARRLTQQAEEDSPAAVLWDPLRGRALRSRIEVSETEGEWLMQGQWTDGALDFNSGLTGMFGVWYPRQSLIVGFVPEEIEGQAGGVVRFKIPKEIYKIQRRKDERARIPRGYEIWATYPSPVQAGEREQARILDLSERGLGIWVPQEQAVSYAKGMILPNVQFQIRSRRMNGSLQIQSISRLEEGVKIGGLWLKLSTADREWLGQYVLEWRIQGST